MSAYLVSSFTITNQDGYQAYLQKVGKTLMDHGAEVLVADYASEAMEGTPAPVTVVIKFASKEAARGWHESPDYQAIIRHRLDSTEGFGVLCEEFTPPGSAPSR